MSRIYGEVYDAFQELYSAIYDCRAMLTRPQHRRLEDAVENLKTLVGVLPDERPLLLPSEPEEPPAEDRPPEL
jgi:hypothetical protein